MERREEYVFTRADLTRGFKECCRVSRFPSPNYVTSKWRNWGRGIKEQDTGFSESWFDVSPFPDSGMVLMWISISQINVTQSRPLARMKG